jgi:hypothetical protein
VPQKPSRAALPATCGHDEGCAAHPPRRQPGQASEAGRPGGSGRPESVAHTNGQSMRWGDGRSATASRGLQTGLAASLGAKAACGAAHGRRIAGWENEPRGEGRVEKAAEPAQAAHVARQSGENAGLFAEQ